VNTEEVVAVLAPREWDVLGNQWAKRAQTLMMRDGTNMDFPNGGHRIRQNPVLIAAIEEIRDAYFQLFNEQRELLKRKTKLPHKEWKAKMEDIDYDLVCLNYQSFNRLQQRNYGFSQITADEILGSVLEDILCDPPEPLTVADAAKITSSIIKRAIDTFELVFKRERMPRCAVPHLPLSKRPEAAGRHRNYPKPTQDSAALVA